MKTYLILFLACFISYSCQDDTEEPNAGDATYQKSVGQCGETWGDTFLDYEVGQELTAAKDFLSSENIPFTTMTLDSLQVLSICVTCHDCPSGWFYILRTDAVYEDKLLSFDFVRQ